MNIKIILFFLFVLTTSIYSQFITGVAPLETGNFWVYQEGDYNRVKLTVVGDTLIDSAIYKITTISNFSSLKLFRLNEDGYYVQKYPTWYPEPDHELKYYKNKVDYGGYWNTVSPDDTTLKWHFNVMDTLTGIVFGVESQIKFIYLEDSSGLWGIWQWWTDEFGMIFESADFAADIYIRGCYIDGIAYGDTALVTGVEDNFPHELSFHLYQNYPNPFNPSTTIKYDITTTGFVDLRVYDLLGNETAVLVNEEKPPGNYTVEFNAGNSFKRCLFSKIKTCREFTSKKNDSAEIIYIICYQSYFADDLCVLLCCDSLCVLCV
jgi:hypothetical protein